MRGRALTYALVGSVAVLVWPSAALAHGQIAPARHLAGAWRLEPSVLVPAAIGACLFARAFWRLRRRGRADHAGWGRVALFGAGVAALVLPLVSPLDAIGDTYLLSAHMLQHVLIGDVAPALLLLALRGPLLLFCLPAPALGRLARRRALRRVLGVLLRPLVAFALWVAAIGAWHVPGAYDYALAHRTVHDLEHLSFLVAGLLVWMQLIDPARVGRLRVGQRAGFAVALLAAGQVLSDWLVLSSRAHYPAYAVEPTRLLGLSPLVDQRLAGSLMMAEQILALGTCLLVLLWPMIWREQSPGVAGVPATHGRGAP